MQPPPYQHPGWGPYGPRPEPPLPPTPPPNWLRRHLGLALGLGCLGSMLLVVFLFFGVFVVASGAMRTSDAYRVAVSTATRDPVVISELGAPIRTGWFVTGSVHVSGSTGDATLTIPLSGSVASGKLNAVARKSAGSWSFSVLNVLVDGRSSAIDLMPRLSAAARPI